MAEHTTTSQAVARAAEFGISAEVAAGVCAAFERLAMRAGRSFDPLTWSKTVWLAEADRWNRAQSPAAHFTLLLHLERLREQFEEKVSRGARAWQAGEVGERLTKR